MNAIGHRLFPRSSRSCEHVHLAVVCGLPARGRMAGFFAVFEQGQTRRFPSLPGFPVLEDGVCHRHTHLSKSLLLRPASLLTGCSARSPVWAAQFRSRSRPLPRRLRLLRGKSLNSFGKSSRPLHSDHCRNLITASPLFVVRVWAAEHRAICCHPACGNSARRRLRCDAESLDRCPDVGQAGLETSASCFSWSRRASSSGLGPLGQVEAAYRRRCQIGFVARGRMQTGVRQPEQLPSSSVAWCCRR